MTTPDTVDVEGLTRRFGDFVAVDDISFQIHAGEIWGFLGPNGAGKSTTIRMLCGVLAPSSGRATVLGYDVARDPEDIKLRIGYMPQGSSLWNDLSVEEHLRFYAGLYGIYGAAQTRTVQAWMERVALTERRAALAGTLPGGYRKRLALACTLLHDPKMIFLDEPTSGVDPLSRREFWDIIVGLAEEGTTVLVTTHYLDEAEHCNELALIYGGKIIARGTPDSLKHASGIGITLEVISLRNVAILDAVEPLAYVRSAGLYGSALHITLEAQTDIPQLQTVLKQKGFEVDSLAPITPSLEDVFSVLVRP